MGIFPDKKERETPMPTAEEKLLAAIKSHGKGWCFTARDFHHLKDTEAVWKGLVRLEKKGLIRRLGRGLYDYPREHPELGKLAPTPEAVAQALAERDGSRLQPSGAYAANLLGLSEQVPARIVFLTSGPHRKIKIGKREIILKHTVPRNMATAGRISGTVCLSWPNAWQVGRLAKSVANPNRCI